MTASSGVAGESGVSSVAMVRQVEERALVKKLLVVVLQKQANCAKIYGINKSKNQHENY